MTMLQAGIAGELGAKPGCVARSHCCPNTLGLRCSGPLYLEDTANQAAIPSERAALVVYRTKATTQYSGAWAAISGCL